MADALDRHKGIPRVWVALAAFAIVATATCLFYFRLRHASKPIELTISRIEHGDDVGRMIAIRGLLADSPGPAEFTQVFPLLIQATKDESEAVRETAAMVIGGLIFRLGKKSGFTDERESTIAALCHTAQEALAFLLDEPSPTLRASAATSLGYAAAIGKLDAPPPRLVACLDDEAEPVRAAAADSLVEYSQGPELLLPVAMRRLPTEGPIALNVLTRVLYNIRFEPSALPLLIEGLSSESSLVCFHAAAAIAHMGPGARPALPAILALIRKELETPHPAHPGVSAEFGNGIIKHPVMAVGQLSQDDAPLPGTVEILCEVLKRETPQRQTSAAWSLGLIGHAAAPAVPLLISTFEATPEVSHFTLRETIALALAEIARGTTDEGRVVDSLTKAWKTASLKQRTAIAQALQRIGPQPEQLAAELEKLPADEVSSWSSWIRRFKYPRSKYAEPVRE